MMVHAFPHELARAALDARIADGSIAHHSGAADDYYRYAIGRIKGLTGAARQIAVELAATADGRRRVIIDTSAGYWDSIVPAGLADKLEARPC